jgi:hypothetical protein
VKGEGEGYLSRHNKIWASVKIDVLLQGPDMVWKESSLRADSFRNERKE